MYGVSDDGCPDFFVEAIFNGGEGQEVVEHAVGRATGDRQAAEFQVAAQQPQAMAHGLIMVMTGGGAFGFVVLREGVRLFGVHGERDAERDFWAVYRDQVRYAHMMFYEKGRADLARQFVKEIEPSMLLTDRSKAWLEEIRGQDAATTDTTK